MRGYPCPSSDDGKHRFQSVLRRSSPPTRDQINACDTASYAAASDVATIVQALSMKEYVVVCQNCGMVAGVTRTEGKAPDGEDDEDDEDDASSRSAESEDSDDSETE